MLHGGSQNGPHVTRASAQLGHGAENGESLSLPRLGMPAGMRPSVVVAAVGALVVACVVRGLLRRRLRSLARVP
jgi:hypothetical protein